MHLMKIERFKKATFASLTMILLILTLLMVVPSTVAHSGDGMYAPPLTVPVAIDGIWSSGEWDDAPQYTMSNSTGGNVGYIRAKFNSTHLFVVIDSPWDTTPVSIAGYWHENFWLAFDTYHDDGWVAPQSDDYLIHGMTDNTPPNGTGMGWIGKGRYLISNHRLLFNSFISNPSNFLSLWFWFEWEELFFEIIKKICRKG